MIFGSLNLLRFGINKLLIEIHAIVPVNTTDIGDALLELTLHLETVLDGHITHAVPPLLNILEAIAFLNQSLYQVSLVG